MGLKDKYPGILGKDRAPDYQSLQKSPPVDKSKMADKGTTNQEVTSDQKESAGCGTIVRDNLLLLLILIGVALGFGLGFGLRPLKPSADAMLWIGLPGEVYMRMLTCTILPLIVSSIISGTATLDPKSNGKISTVSLAYITLINGFGVLLGLAMFFIVKPGDGVEATSGVTDTPETNLHTQDLFVDLIRNLFPNNIITACFQTSQTVYVPHLAVKALNSSNSSIEELVRSEGTSSSMNILGLIVLSSVIGMATSQVGELAQPFVQFFRATSEIIIKVLRWIVWFTPIGVVSLIAASVADVDDLASTFESVGMFVIADCICMALLTIVVFPLMYFIVTRKNPMKFLLICIRPYMTSLATASTAVAMPDMFYVCESKLDIDIRISRFVVPFSDALNRSGSCCFILISTLFLCNLEGAELEAPQYLVVAILTWVSGFAIPSVPSASIISVIIILSSVNIQPTNIGLLLALEWLLDRLRTSVNCISIIMGAVLTNRLCKKDLNKRLDTEATAMSTDVEVKVSYNNAAADTNM